MRVDGLQRDRMQRRSGICAASTMSTTGATTPGLAESSRDAVLAQQ